MYHFSLRKILTIVFISLISLGLSACVTGSSTRLVHPPADDPIPYGYVIFPDNLALGTKVALLKFVCSSGESCAGTWGRSEVNSIDGVWFGTGGVEHVLLAEGTHKLTVTYQQSTFGLGTAINSSFDFQSWVKYEIQHIRLGMKWGFQIVAVGLMNEAERRAVTNSLNSQSKPGTKQS